MRAERAAKEAQAALDYGRLQSGRCALCDASLYGVRALDVFDRRCCSSVCVVALRRRLAGEAAEKRLVGGSAR